MLYSIRSERLLMEEMDYNLLFRWFVGAGGGAGASERSDLRRAFHGRWHAAGSVGQCEGFPAEGRETGPPDDPGNPTVNFRGEKRSNKTHASKTDPDALLARKSEGKESKLSYSGNLLIENRNGLIVDAEVFQANGTAERDAALIMLEKLRGTQS